MSFGIADARSIRGECDFIQLAAVTEIRSSVLTTVAVNSVVEGDLYAISDSTFSIHHRCRRARLWTFRRSTGEFL